MNNCYLREFQLYRGDENAKEETVVVLEIYFLFHVFYKLEEYTFCNVLNNAHHCLIYNLLCFTL